MTHTPSSHQDPLEASLLTLLAWFEQPMSAASLRSRIAHDPQQAWTHHTLIEAADSLGLDTEEIPLDPAHPTLPPLPAICILNDGTSLAILEKTSDNDVRIEHLSHPAGRFTLCTIDSLLGQRTQHTVSFRKRSLTTTPTGRGRHGHWFWGPLIKNKAIYIQVGFAAFLINVFAIASSVFSMIVYDRVIPNNAIDTLIALLAGVSIIFVADFVIRTLRGYFLDMASAKADAAIADALFEHILDVQLKARQGSTGALASVLKEFESVRDFLTSATLTTFIDIPFTVIFIILIFLIGGPIVWIPLIALPIMILAGVVVQPQLKQLTKQSQEDGHQKHAILIETLSGLETIKALGAGAIMRRRWQTAITHQSHLGLKSRMLAQLASNVANLAQQFVQVSVITLGALLVQKGQMGYGAIMACTILAGRAVAPIAQITQLLTRLNQTLTSYKSLDQIMSQAREHQQGQTFVARPAFSGAIEFRDVTFSYPKATQPTLKNVSFTISPGERVAIVGKIGSGKTTISKLILGLYTPDTGSVLIDGIDVRQIDPADLRQALGVVLQEVWLISGTVKQNIALGAAFPSDTDILQAAQTAGVEDFIRLMPQGYNLRLGERGEGLSGGQRQAIAIARALLGQPSIFLFDEATSSMDAGAEAQLIERLKTAIGTRTFITITHKAAMLPLVNTLIVLDQGKVVAQGSPEQVMQQPHNIT